MSTNTKVKHTAADIRSARLYFRDLGGSMVGYVAALVAAIILARHYPDWKVPLAFLPMVPLTFAFLAVMRYFRRLDELGRMVQMEAVGFAFTSGVMLAASYGFLESIAGFPRISWTFVGPLFIALWGIGGCVAARRYR